MPHQIEDYRAAHYLIVGRVNGQIVPTPFWGGAWLFARIYQSLVRPDGDLLRCLMIELRETEIDVLIGKGLLNSEIRHDSRVVREALYVAS